MVQDLFLDSGFLVAPGSRLAEINGGLCGTSLDLGVSKNQGP